MNGVNLIPAPRRLVRARTVRTRVWIAGLCAYAATLAGAYAWLAARAPGTADWAAQRARAEQEQQSLTRDTAAALAVLAREESARLAAAAVEGQPDWSMLFAVLARTAGGDIWIESASLKPAAARGEASRAGPAGEPERTLGVAGMGRTQDAVSSFVLALEETGLFSRVSLLETRRKALAQGEAIDFRVECSLGGREGP